MLVLFRDVMRFGYNHGSIVLALVLPFLVPLIAAKIAASLWANDQPVWHGVYFSVLLALYPFYMGRVIKYLAWLAGPPSEAPANLSINAREWRHLFVVNLIVTVMVSFGLLVFILPGVYLAARLAFAEFVTLLRDQLPSESLATSWREAETQMWPLFAGTLVVFAVSTLLEVPLAVNPEATTWTKVVLSLTDEIISLLTTLVLTIFFFRVYCLARDAG